ncbi:MAG: four-helix bundle copper-binding protein [Gammaproteobacteria bacterium]|nr:four-helix bundle copper-binding protein [Gammaproteobacteria bacterium]
MAKQFPLQDRRAFLVTSGLAALTAAPALAAAAEESGEHHDAHEKYGDLIREALHCIETGNACAAHCIDDLRSGNTELVECLVQVQELVIACEALAKLAAHDSEHLKTYAAATIEVCDTCEAECRKFEKKHEACKDCADACVACRKECERIIA